MTRRNSKTASPAASRPAKPVVANPAGSLMASSWQVPALLAALHLVIALVAFHPTPFTGGDDASYISLARSLIVRHDYTDIWDPALPAQTVYPPIFPVIVAGGLLLGLDIEVGLKMMMVFISSAAVFASCLWLWRVGKPGVAIGAGVLVALSPEIIGLGRDVLSDTPFWLFTMVALIALAKVQKHTNVGGGEADSKDWRWELMASLAIVAAYFTRSAGLPLLMGALVWFVVSKRRRGALILLVTSLPFILAWWLRGRSHAGSGYLGPFLYIDPYIPSLGTIGAHDLVVRLQENLYKYRLSHIPRILTGKPSREVFTGTAITVLAGFGWVLRLRKPNVAEFWTFFYMGLVLLWPVSWGAPRFLLAIIPVLALYTAESIGFLLSFTRWPGFAGQALIAALVGVTLPGVVHHFKDGEMCRAAYADGDEFPCTEPIFRDFFLTAAAVKGQLPPGSVVLSRKPTLFYLYSGYQSRLYPLSAVPDSLFDEADRIHAKFLVIDQIRDLTPLYLRPVLLARRNDFCVVPEFSHPKALLARIDRGGPPLPPGGVPNALRVCRMHAVASSQFSNGED